MAYTITTTITFPDIDLVKTCDACPEQYDVFRDGRMIGYLRLRHGYFRADYPDTGGWEVYGTRTIGDGLFHEDERDTHLFKAITALIQEDNKAQGRG